MEELFSVSYLARLWKVSERTVLDWIREGRLLAVRLGAQWRIRAEEVERVAREGVPREE